VIPTSGAGDTWSGGRQVPVRRRGQWPVFITGNRISVDTPMDAVVSAMSSASTIPESMTRSSQERRLRHDLRRLRTYGYMRGAAILDNDFSGLQAAHQIVFQATDSVVAGNILGPILPFSAGFTNYRRQRCCSTRPTSIPVFRRCLAHRELRDHAERLQAHGSRERGDPPLLPAELRYRQVQEPR